MIRIIIADDHRMIREGLRALLRDIPQTEVIGEADNGHSAVKLAHELSPDVVLMDISMPDLDGVQATRQLTSNGNGMKIVALSGRASARSAAEMLRAGASAFVCKEAAFGELATALQSVVDQRVYISPMVIEAVTAEMQKHNGHEHSKLSPREQEVLKLMAVGRTTKEIARDLHLSAKTVETHRRNLMEKLQLFGVAELTKYAIREGLTTADA